MNDEPQPPENPLSRLAQAAVQLHELYLSLQQAAFTPAEALELVKTHMRPHH